MAEIRSASIVASFAGTLAAAAILLSAAAQAGSTSGAPHSKLVRSGSRWIVTSTTRLDSRRFGVIMHSPAPNAGTLRIDQGSTFNTNSTSIQVKGVAANIVVDHASLHAGDGILIQAMVNDDPFAPQPPAGTDTPVTAVLRHVALSGDLINSRTNQGDMTVTLQDASLTGAISTAIAAPATGVKPTEKTYYLIGDVKNTFGPTAGPFGLEVSVDGHSSWTVDKTSYLTKLAIAAGAKIAPPPGYRLHLRVDGRSIPCIRERTVDRSCSRCRALGRRSGRRRIGSANKL